MVKCLEEGQGDLWSVMLLDPGDEAKWQLAMTLDRPSRAIQGSPLLLEQSKGKIELVIFQCSPSYLKITYLLDLCNESIALFQG